MALFAILAQLTFALEVWTLSAHSSPGSECSASDCTMEKIKEAAYVTALYEHFPVLSGCISRERTADMQEVHAVIIRGVATGQRSGWTATTDNRVDVIIKHRNRTANELAIFILVAASPTVWHIRSEQIANSSIGRFLISNNSRIDNERRNKLKVKKMKLSVDSAQLERWIRRKWNAVTTLMELELANVITVAVGLDPSASGKCEIVPHLTNIYAAHAELQETRGCLARWNEATRGRDVHIIELLSPSVDFINNTRYKVILNIRQKSRPVTSRHVVLILKSHLPVHWHVITHGLRGTLDIITDQLVDSSSTNMQSFRVAVESLTAYTGQDLVSWTCDKYGLPVSYTEAQLANQFDLVIDGGDNLPKTRPTQFPDILPMERRLQDSPDSDKQVGSGSYDDGLALKELKLTIIKSLVIECGEASMTLTVHKGSLMYHNFLPSRVSFLDASCVAQNNGTQYVLLTKGHACGTSVTTSSDTISFTNAIVVEWLMGFPGVNSSLNSFQHGQNRDRLSPILLTINVSCDYPLPVVHKEATLVPVLSDIQFRLKLFHDATYQNEILAFPTMVSDQDFIYVQANITADSCIRVNARNCLLESADQSVSSNSVEHHLIVNGCFMEKSMQWINVNGKGSFQNQHFKFRFQRIWDIGYTVNLRCDLTVCTVCSSLTLKEVPQCNKVREQPCGPTSSHSDGPRSSSQIMATVMRGPVVLLTPSSGIARENDIVPEHEVDEVCDQVIRVEGLSTEIVVCIAFTAFFIGILLTASLWCIHIRTGPSHNKAKSGLRSLSNSGDSTPSSTAPISIHQVTAHH